MDAVIWGGIAVTLAGLGGLIWCILNVMRARKAGLPEAEMKAKLQKAVALNMGALFLSTIGLMMVVVGLFLG